MLTNADLEKKVDTSDEWIASRTGIRQRHIAGADETTSSMGAKAARCALEKAGVQPSEVDLIIVATCTPDMPFPATACWIQKELGSAGAAAFDLTAACSGFMYALSVGEQFVKTGAAKTALVIGAEKISTVLDWTDRNTCVLFGDGAGAVVLRHISGQPGIRSTVLGADGRHTDILHLSCGSNDAPSHHPPKPGEPVFMHMSGREVFKVAVVGMHKAATEALERSGLTLEQISCIIPHQANIRIIEAIADRMKIGTDRFFINVQNHGNTSAASIPVALDEAISQGRVKKGDSILFVAFGGGLTWASSVITL